MFDPMNRFHKLCCHLLFQLPRNRRRLDRCMSLYLPILENVFTDNPATLFLLMCCLEKIGQGDIEGAQRIIRALQPVFAANDTPPVRVLWHVLHALHQSKSGHTDKMAANLRTANQIGHRYHIAYVLYAEYLYSERHFYDEAEQNFLKAVDCLYSWPPVTDEMRRVIGIMYNRIAYTRIMMHRYDDAKDALRVAESMSIPPEELWHFKALLSAALRLPAEARRCLEQLQAVAPDQADIIRHAIQLVLEDKHPHFTRLPIGTPEGIAAFWQNFLNHEEDMMQLLRDNRVLDARKLMAGPLEEMDPYENDMWGFDVLLQNSSYTIFFQANYSQTYASFIDSIVAACPPEIRQRWHIVRKP